jgi:hypothetical protein
MTVPFASRLEELFGGIRALAGAVLPLGAPAGAALALAGLVALTVATRRRRILAAAGGAAVGALAALALRGWLSDHLAMRSAASVPALAAAGALGCAAIPWAFPFAAAALPGALLGALVPLAGRPELGAGIAAAIAGVLGLTLARLVSAAFASLCGGLLLALGLLAAFGRTPLARELADRPAAVAAFALVFGVAGAVFQLSRSPAAPADRSPVSPP